MTTKAQVLAELKEELRRAEAALTQRQNTALALKARDNFLAFCQLMRPDFEHPDDFSKTTFEIAPHHDILGKTLQKIERGDWKKVMVSMPPRSGKTEMAIRLYVSWLFGRNPLEQIIIASYGQDLSRDHSSDIRAVMSSDRYKAVFPQAFLDPNQSSLDKFKVRSHALKKGRGHSGYGQLFATSVGGALSGRGAGYLILDDAIKDSNTAASARIREKLWGWYQSTFATRLLSSTGRQLLIGTRWSDDDLFARLIDPNNDYYRATEAKHWRVLNLPALAEDKDPIGRAPGEALWPSRFPVEYLRQLQNADPNNFEALYQGRPTPVTGVLIQASWIKTFSSMAKMPKPDELRWYMSVDFAASTASTADFSVVIVAGVDEYSRIWVHPQSFVGKVTSDVLVDCIMKLVAQFKPNALFGEKGVLARSIGPFLRKRMVEEQTFCTVIDMPVTSDKVARAQSIVARMAQGLVHYPGMTDWWAEANRQLVTFPRGAHDDFVDGMSLLGMGLTMMAPASKPGLIGKPGEAIPEVGTLGWVKWSAEREKRSQRYPASQGW